MKYITVAAAAKKLKISPIMVRKYCASGRIPGAICKNKAWHIPADVKHPERAPAPKKELPPMPPLAAKLYHQKNGRNYHGLYDYTASYLTYCSSRMASGRLTLDQINMIFHKGKFVTAFEPNKVSDLIEALNHCYCVDHILENVMQPLNIKFITNLHYMLTIGSVDQRVARVHSGEFRNSCIGPKGLALMPGTQVKGALSDLIQKYEHRESISLEDILDFHVRFERIFPFEDYNGRIGRLIMFKECLRHNVTPFIFPDKCRCKYLNGIRNWDRNRSDFLTAARCLQEDYESEIAFHIVKAREYQYGTADEMIDLDDIDEEDE